MHLEISSTLDQARSINSNECWLIELPMTTQHLLVYGKIKVVMTFVCHLELGKNLNGSVKR